MNKVVAVLGVIVLITLAMIFFCIGFFTGSTTISSSIVNTRSKNEEKPLAKKITPKNINELTDINSATISEKITKMLNAAGSATDAFTKDVIAKKRKLIDGEDAVTIDSLLREIASTHSPHDDCSYQKTMTQIHAPKPVVDKGLHGKKIVFIGYFKNNIAVQIQKLLISKGYKVHVELSKNSDNTESFVFCGPFKKDENAKKLASWLRKHSFADTRIVSITKEAVEETLYDVFSEDSSIPENIEKDVQDNNAGNAHNSTKIPAVSQ
jgi:ribulose bisphosphate carboxylase small subunit